MKKIENISLLEMKSSNLINGFNKLVLNEQRDNTLICAHHHFPMVKSPKYVALKKNKKKKTLNKLIFPISQLKNKIKKIKQNIIILAHQFPNVQPLHFPCSLSLSSASPSLTSSSKP